ncbi:hypothetical protein DC20_21610 (plasmid) [Rufibacter tibetensis]|uniref:Uncharacterized protein n=1 Tax=Rufibacter tibetensis TaxID=512763 RepID=A0A0P0CPK3_9BACT|nr:hypothetical protein DC20_21610 [Rufibacter tibetensis]
MQGHQAGSHRGSPWPYPCLKAPWDLVKEATFPSLYGASTLQVSLSLLIVYLEARKSLLKLIGTRFSLSPICCAPFRMEFTSKPFGLLDEAVFCAAFKT